MRMSTEQGPDQRRVALVTGSSRGIGRATTLRLAREHRMDCVVHYRRDHEAADGVASELSGIGVRALVCKAEIESPEEITAMFDRVRDEFGRLDVLVANAASTAFRSLLEVEPKHIDRTFATVVRSFILLTQQAAPLMGHGGRVIAMSGMDSDFVQRGHGLIGAAKAAMETLVRYFAVELGGRGITVNAVQPGYIASDSSRLYLGEHAVEFEKQIAKYTPGGTPGTVEDVAAMVSWLCSPDAQFVNAQNLTFDGGLSALGGPWADLNERLPY